MNDVSVRRQTDDHRASAHMKTLARPRKPTGPH